MGRLIILLSAEVGAIALAGKRTRALLLVHDAWWTHPAELATTVLVVVHVAALLAATWILLGTVHDVAVAAAQAHGRADAGTRLAPRWVHSVVQRAVASLLLGVLAGSAVPAVAQDRDPVAAMQVVTPPVPPRALPSAALPSPALPPQPVVPSEGSNGSAAVDPSVSAGAIQSPAEPVSTHVVAAGENLWVIARAILLAARETGEPTDREVHAYWVQLVEQRPGDPDLILPGEVLPLPPIPTAGGQA